MAVMESLKRWWSGSPGYPNPLENPNVPLTGNTLSAYVGGYWSSSSGEPVTTETALSLSPVWQATALLSGDVAKLPWITYRRMPDGSRDNAVGHVVYKLTKYSMGWQTTNLWLQAMMTSGLLYGNGFAEIIRDTNRMPRACRFVDAYRVNIIQLDNQEWYYQIHGITGEVRNVDRRDMFHLVGPQINELGGMPLIQYARNTLGRHLGADYFASDFFLNGAVPSGYFKTLANFKTESARNAFIESVQKRHSGSGNRFKVGLLPNNIDWVPAGIHPQDALLVDQLKLQPKDVARFFNLPPHKLGDETRTSYSSLEQENQSYLDSSLMPWLDRFDSEATDKLFPPSNLIGGEASYYTEFNVNALVRADFKSRMESYVKAVNNGLLNANEIRQLENRNAYDGGDDFYMPSNMMNISDPDKTPRQPQTTPAVQNPPDDPNDEDDQAEAMRAVFVDAVRRQVAKVLARAEQQAAKPETFLAWLDTIHDRVMPEMEPSLRPVAKLGGIDPKNLAKSIVDPAQRLLRLASEVPEAELKTSVSQTRGPLLEASIKVIEVML